MRWTVRALAGGPRRVNHAAVAVGKVIYSFGGYCTGDNYKDVRPIDVFCLNTTNYRWSALPKPDEHSPEADDWPYQRYGHTVVAHGKKIYLFGGRNDFHSCNRLYCFDTESHQWSCPDVYGYIPSARDGHSACVYEHAMYIYGGYAAEQNFPAVYRLNLHNFEWTLLDCKGNPPIYRDFHTATAMDNKMFIFGGRSDNGDFTGLATTEFYSDRLVYLDLNTLRWEKPHLNHPRPIGRRSHSAVALDDHRLLIFGGYNSRTELHMNDLWLLDITSWKWHRLNPHGKGPEPRRRQSLCQVGNQLFIFGGTSPHDGPPLIFSKAQQENMPDNQPKHLIDHNDTYVLDLSPSLRTLTIDYVIQHPEMFNLECLPHGIRYDIECMTKENNLSAPLRFKTLPLG